MSISAYRNSDGDPIPFVNDREFHFTHENIKPSKLKNSELHSCQVTMVTAGEYAHLGNKGYIFQISNSWCSTCDKT